MAGELDPDLPDALHEEAAVDSQTKSQRRQSLSMLVARKRDEAVDGRSASGIESIWEEDDSHYEGYDAANQGESRVLKPTTSAGPVTRATPLAQTRSTMFLNITRPYVDTAAARVGDMLLPTDDRSFAIVPDPIPEMTSLKEDASPVKDATGAPVMKPQVGPDGKPMMGPDGQPMQVQATVADLVQREMATAKDSAEKAQRRIDDWLVECQYHAEKRKAIHDCAKLGVGILKGPVPVKRINKVLKALAEGGAELVIQEDIKPATKRVDPWNLFPDPACGENIHNGNYLLEKDYLTEKKLRELMGVPGYLDDEIKECIKEGPQKQNVSDGKVVGGRDTKGLFQVWYYYGAITKEDLEAANCDLSGKTGDIQYAIITMVNDRVIKAALNHLDSGEFPYDAMPWQVRSGMWAGIGVARQMRPAQGMIVAASRNMMDNAALTGGPIIAVNRSMLEPVDDDFTLRPRKVFVTTEEAEGVDIRSAIATFNIPSMQQELMNIIEMAEKMAERLTGLPMLLQGDQGSAPDTLGGQLLANNNASTVLRRIARLDDDYMTEPHIRRYYEYLLLYGPEDDEKKQFTVDARGSSALVDRDIQNHALAQMMPLLTNPQNPFGVDPKKAFAELCRSQKIDVKTLQYSEEEMKKLAAQPPQPPPQLAVAQINAQVKEKVATIQAQAATQIAQGHDAVITQRSAEDTDRDTAYTNSLATRDEIARQRATEDFHMKRELMTLEYALKRNISLDEAKVELTKWSGDLRVQMALSGHDKAAPQVATPAIEPPERASPGHAFTE